MKRFVTLAAIFLFFLGLDGFVKSYVHHHLPLADFSSSYPYQGVGVFKNSAGIDFSIVHAINTGAAWGAFANFQSPLLIFRILVIIGIAIYLFFFCRQRKIQMPLLLILTGALGNVMDYWIYGHVVDMFYFRFFGYSYPVFNIADSIIFLGTFWLIIRSFLQKRSKLSLVK